MKDELVRRVVGSAFVSIAIGLSGCNGCSGCEGQTVEPQPTVAAEDEPTPGASAAPSAEATAPVPSSSVMATPSSAPTFQGDRHVGSCCNAIAQNLYAAPDKQKATWKKALDACNEAAVKQKGAEGRAKVREILTQTGWPGSCRD